MASKGRDLGNIVSPQTGIAVTISGDPIVLGVGNTALVEITGGGLIGIKTDNPIANLQVTNGAGGGTLLLGARNSNAKYQYINFNGTTAGDHAWQIGRSPASGIGPDNGLYVYNLLTSSTEIGITTTGNIGVRTITPSSTFTATFQNTASISAGIAFSDSSGTLGGYISLGAAGSGTSSKVMMLQGANQVQVAVGNTARLSVDINGRVLTPGQPAFHMENSGDSSVWKSGTVHVNIGNHFNNTTGVFTVPVAGTYLFQLHGQSNGAGYWYAGIKVNGSSKATWYSDETNLYKHASCTLIYTCAANDTVTGEIISASVVLNIGGQNGFCGFLIG